MQKNDLVTVQIEDMGTGGEGIGKVDGCALFIKDAIIGDLVEAKIMKMKKNYGYARLMNINIVGTFLCCKYFGQYMVKQKQGSIVNIASFTGTIVNKPPFNMSGYCTSKGGVLHLTRSLPVNMENIMSESIAYLQVF